MELPESNRIPDIKKPKSSYEIPKETPRDFTLALKKNYFDPINSSPKDNFLLTLQNRMNVNQNFK
jgi:hypothetical protein